MFSNKPPNGVTCTVTPADATSRCILNLILGPVRGEKKIFQ